MLTATPTRFRSRYTGNEIDNLLTSISDKIDSSYIVNDFTGGADLVASAELAKTLYNNSQKFSDPNYIKQLILSIPNAVVVYQSDMDKLNRLAGTFQGSYATSSDRNTAVNANGFKGGELTFLISDGNGCQELSYWDAGSLTWVKSRFLPSQVSDSTTYQNAGSVIGITMDTNKYEAGRYIVKAESATDILVFEVTVVFKNGNTYWSTCGQIGSNLNLAKVVNCTLNVSTLSVNMNVLSNTTIKFFKVAEF